MEIEICFPCLEKSRKEKNLSGSRKRHGRFRFFLKLFLADGWKVKKFRILCVKRRNVQPMEHFTHCFHQSSCQFSGRGTGLKVMENSWKFVSQFLCEPRVYILSHQLQHDFVLFKVWTMYQDSFSIEEWNVFLDPQA